MHNKLTRYSVFKFLAENLKKYIQFDKEDNEPDDSLISAIVLIKTLLEGVEELLNKEYEKLDKKEIPQESSIIYDDILVVLSRNVKESETYSSELKSNFAILKKLNKLEKLLNEAKNTKKKTWYSARRLVFHYLKQTTNLSEKIFNIYTENIIEVLDGITDDYFSDKNEVEIFSEKIEKRAFLSYAYDDKLFTLGIFFMFLENEILLYIDWIFNEKTDDTEELKKELDFILSNCDYFIFLRTLNSELSIAGSKQIRQWCSWEIGRFYEYAGTKKGTKFCINTFDIKEENNALLKNFRFFETIGDIKSS